MNGIDSLNVILKNNREVWNKLHRSGYRGYSKSNGKWREKDGYSLKNLLRHLPPRWINKERVILDIGCGIGCWMEDLSSLIREVHGVDISEEAVKQGEKNLRHLKNVYFHVTDGMHLSMFKRGKFDLVYSIACFQHIPRKAAASYAHEAYRVLKPHSYFIIQTRSPTRVEDIGCIERETTLGYSRRQLENLIEDSGLTLVSIKTQENHNLPWFWTVAEKVK